jgi:hypothetical protein
MLLEMLYLLLACKIFFRNLQTTMRIDHLSRKKSTCWWGPTTGDYLNYSFYFSCWTCSSVLCPHEGNKQNLR